MRDKMKKKAAPHKGVSITISLTDFDMDVTLDEFAKRLRDTADVLSNIDRARPGSGLSCWESRDVMMIGFDKPMNPIRANVRIKTEFGTTDGSSLIGATLTADDKTSVQIFKSHYDIVKDASANQLTIKELAELSVIDLPKEICALDEAENKDVSETLTAIEARANQIRSAAKERAASNENNRDD